MRQTNLIRTISIALVHIVRIGNGLAECAGEAGPVRPHLSDQCDLANRPGFRELYPNVVDSGSRLGRDVFTRSPSLTVAVSSTNGDRNRTQLQPPPLR